MNRRRTVLLLAVAGGLLGGCQSQPERADMIRCKDPRPAVCTRDYRPVCGYVASEGTWQTYGNACEACSDVGVKGYRAGACEQDPAGRPGPGALP